MMNMLDRKMHFVTRKKGRPKRRLVECWNEDVKGIRVEDTENRRRRIRAGTDTGI